MDKAIRNFYDLNVWQRSRFLAVELYKVTGDFPKEEVYGIVSQIRRSGISVPTNIAEGFGRYYFKDKIRFYYQSRGSLYEVQNLLIISRDLEYLKKEKYIELFIKTQDVSRLIWGLIKSTEKNIPHKD